MPALTVLISKTPFFITTNYTGFMAVQLTNEFYTMAYDGTNNPTLIANPEVSNGNTFGIGTFPIIYKDTLFYLYYNTSGVTQLVKFGGTSLSLSSKS